MNDIPSKRLRLRFFPEDERAIAHSLTVTVHSSQSNVIRAALALYEQVWSSKQGGFHVVYRREGVPDLNVLEPAFTRGSAGAQQDDSGKRSKTQKSVEIRVTPSDYARIEALLAMEAGDTYSAVVRRAIRLYSLVVSKCKEGWRLVAVSPSGDVLTLTVPGMGVLAKLPVTRSPLPAAHHTVAEPTASRMYDLLPLSLRDTLTSLASSQNTSVDMLIVDMLYRQAAAPATESAPPAQEVVSVPLASEPPVEPVIDDTALEDAFAAIARMSESLGKLEQTLTDVDLPAAPQESVEGAQQEQGANADQLPALLNGLADRLENILSGAQAQRRTRPSKRTSPRLETEPLLFSDHEM